MEKTYIENIENGIRGIRMNTKTPAEAKVGYSLNRLKPLNLARYEELLQKYKNVLADSKNRK